MTPACPFCEKVTRLEALSPGEIVWRFPHSVAFLGQWQFYEGYCVLVSRRHATELSQLDDAERRHFLDEMCLLARAVERAYRPHKLNYELLGNQVPHLHWHVFPRSLDDPHRLDPVWLAIDAAGRDEVLRRKLEGPTERDTIARRIAGQLSSLGAAQA